MSKIHPLGMQAVPVEYVVERVMDEKPKAIICLAINQDNEIRFMHSSMTIEMRAYLIRVADAIVTQQILKTTITGESRK